MQFISARTVLLGSVAAAALHAAPAFAQDAAAVEAIQERQESQTAAQDAAQIETDTIVVTARRVTELLQNVPASVSAFDGRALERLQAKDLTDLQGAVPNLNIVQGRGSSNATNVFIRGVGQPDALQTFDPAVGVYIDDVYLSRIRGAQLDMLDVDRIEVLRGPQGTLYGKNTIGGAIKFITRKPTQDVWMVGSAEIGSYDQVTLKGAVSGPVAPTLAAGISGMFAHRDGYVEDRVLDRDYNDKDTVAVRGALAFTPTESARIDISADYSRDEAALNVGRPVNDLVTFSGTILPVEDPVGSGKYDWTGRTTPGLPNSTKLTHYGVSATGTIDLSDTLSFKSITAYRNLNTDDYIDIDATQYEVGDVFVGVNQEQASQEFQLLYSGDRLSGVAGVYYLDEDIASHQEAYADDVLGPLFLNSPFLRTIDDTLETKSYAAYANATYEIVPNVRLSGGLRYTHETKDYWRTTSTFYGLLPAFNATFDFAPPKGKWSDWSPMASIDWQATPNTMVYARVAKGFKSGGFNGRANTALEASEYDPETVWSYEAGFKTFLMRQLRLNGTVFRADYKDFQARISGTDIDPITGLPAPLLSVLNAGKLRMQGVELESVWTPTRGLMVDAQLGYLDAEYKEFVDERFPDDSRAFQTPAFAPKWTLRLGGQYAFELGNAGSLTVGGATRYRSRQALAVDNTFIIGSGVTAVGTTTEVEGLFQDAYWVHDARIVWEDARKKFSVGLYGQNLSDRAYKTDAQEFSSVGNIRTVYYGAPRTFTLRLTARY